MTTTETCTSRQDRPRSPALRATRWTPYVELAKARLVGMVLFTTLIGYVMAPSDTLVWWRLIATLVGTALAASGAGALNQWLEDQIDARMERTRNRPLPSGQIGNIPALLIGVVASLGGSVLVAATSHWLAAGLTVSAVAVYVLIYTPLKPLTSVCTLIGAYCGAVPPLIGWAAATGQLDYGAWALAAVLYVWQIPHSLALAWLYRQDYARAGLRILTAFDATGRLTFELILLYALTLLPLSLTVILAGLAGEVYMIGALSLGTVMIVLCVRLYWTRTARAARHVFIASIIYLPVVLGLMWLDRRPSMGTPEARSSERSSVPAIPSPSPVPSPRPAPGRR